MNPVTYQNNTSSGENSQNEQKTPSTAVELFNTVQRNRDRMNGIGNLISDPVRTVSVLAATTTGIAYTLNPQLGGTIAILGMISGGIEALRIYNNRQDPKAAKDLRALCEALSKNNKDIKTNIGNIRKANEDSVQRIVEIHGKLESAIKQLEKHKSGIDSVNDQRAQSYNEFLKIQKEIEELNKKAENCFQKIADIQEEMKHALTSQESDEQICPKLEQLIEDYNNNVGESQSIHSELNENIGKLNSLYENNNELFKNLLGNALDAIGEMERGIKDLENDNKVLALNLCESERNAQMAEMRLKVAEKQAEIMYDKAEKIDDEDPMGSQSLFIGGLMGGAAGLFFGGGVGAIGGTMAGAGAYHYMRKVTKAFEDNPELGKPQSILDLGGANIFFAFNAKSTGLGGQTISTVGLAEPGSTTEGEIMVHVGDHDKMYKFNLNQADSISQKDLLDLHEFLENGYKEGNLSIDHWNAIINTLNSHEIDRGNKGQKTGFISEKSAELLKLKKELTIQEGSPKALTSEKAPLPALEEKQSSVDMDDFVIIDDGSDCKKNSPSSSSSYYPQGPMLGQRKGVVKLNDDYTRS